jgi:hypothetical protein
MVTYNNNRLFWFFDNRSYMYKKQIFDSMMINFDTRFDTQMDFGANLNSCCYHGTWYPVWYLERFWCKF